MKRVGFFFCCCCCFSLVIVVVVVVLLFLLFFATISHVAWDGEILQCARGELRGYVSVC